MHQKVHGWHNIHLSPLPTAIGVASDVQQITDFFQLHVQNTPQYFQLIWRKQRLQPEFQGDPFLVDHQTLGVAKGYFAAGRTGFTIKVTQNMTLTIDSNR